MSDITPEAVERFIQTTMKEAVMSEGMPRNADDTKDAYATVSLLRALSARIAELEATSTAYRLGRAVGRAAALHDADPAQATPVNHEWPDDTCPPCPARSAK